VYISLYLLFKCQALVGTAEKLYTSVEMELFSRGGHRYCLRCVLLVETELSVLAKTMFFLGAGDKLDQLI